MLLYRLACSFLLVSRAISFKRLSLPSAGIVTSRLLLSRHSTIDSSDLNHMTRISKVRADVRKAKDFTPEKAKRFFKCGPGEYSEHDQFLGASNPTLRKIAKEHVDMSFEELSELLGSAFNEERNLALMILTLQYQQCKEDEDRKKAIYDYYMSKLSAVNNWNLVDVSCHIIVGDYLLNRDKTTLHTLVRSEVMWERRVGIVSTLGMIRAGHYDTTLVLAEALLNDDHDLIHKATGWMLREVGKKHKATLTTFLNKYAVNMPRTALRYAIERLDERDRKKYLNLNKPK